MNLGTRDFHLLTVLANELHFGRAADALGMRQPQLSTRLAQIERAVGVELFVRRPKVSLTPAGRMIVDAGRRALTDFETAVEQARLVERGQIGAIVTAIGSSVMLTNIPQSIQRFREQYPDVGITLRDMHSRQQWEALGAGQIDVAITREIGVGKSLKSEIIGRQRFVVLMPSNHPLAKRKKIALEELKDESFVLFQPVIAPGLHHQINALCIRAGFSPKIVQEAEEWYTVLGFVRAGFGITITLDMPGAPVLADVASCPLEGMDTHSPIFLCWDEDRRSASRDLFLDWLRKDAQAADKKPGGAKARAK
ncbi:LysR family transcriptional regulator [Hyphococcus sp.]|jgi:DNA-binding transcriptional LysR family regulator|uniref:LysR family transcriptional regulator n=1 Tax=Hyphococcus sp. TaxID=2038636 RepID=UPI003D144398